MVKVTKGALGGERDGGYSLYTTAYGVGPSVGVRRQIPTTALPTIGTSLAQKRQKECFAAATKTYKNYNVLEKDFYKRYWVLDKKIDTQGITANRILTGRQLAIKEIARTICTSGEKYPKPLGFCICAVDMYGDPAPEHELNITSEKLGNFEYKELNDEYACFPPSSLSAKHETYHLFYTDAADYCLLTAEEIHKIKTLCIDKIILFQHVEKTDYGIQYHTAFAEAVNYEDHGLPAETYEMTLTVKWENVKYFSGGCLFFAPGIGSAYVPMPIGSHGDTKLKVVSGNHTFIFWNLYGPHYPYHNIIEGVEFYLYIENLPC